MKITRSISIDLATWEAATEVARQDRSTFSRLVEDALLAALKRAERATAAGLPSGPPPPILDPKFGSSRPAPRTGK